MLKYFTISILVIVSPLISDEDNLIPSFTTISEPEKIKNEDNLIPSFTTTSKPEKIKIEFGLNNKNYDHYYHKDGTSLGIDNFDCGSDGQCQEMYQDVLDWDDFGSDGLFNTDDEDGTEGNGEIDSGETVRDGHDLLFSNDVVGPIANPFWNGYDANGSENDGINGKNIYTSNGVAFDVMYHGANGVGIDLHLFKEQRNYTFLADILDNNLEYHPYWNPAFETQQDLTHYDFGVYYVWNEILLDTPLINTKSYTFPTTRLLSGLYLKGSNNRTLNSSANSIYLLNAMDLMISNSMIWSNQLIIDYKDGDNISPCSMRTKLIWNIGSKIALAPSLTYKKYDSIEMADLDVYEGFIMFEGAYQFSNINSGNFNYDIKLIPYFKMSILGSENLVHAKNEFGLDLKVFFN